MRAGSGRDDIPVRRVDGDGMNVESGRGVEIVHSLDLVSARGVVVEKVKETHFVFVVIGM